MKNLIRTSKFKFSFRGQLKWTEIVENYSNLLQREWPYKGDGFDSSGNLLILIFSSRIFRVMYLEDVQKCENVTLEEYIVPKLIEIKFIHKLYIWKISQSSLKTIISIMNFKRYVTRRCYQCKIVLVSN